MLVIRKYLQTAMILVFLLGIMMTACSANIFGNSAAATPAPTPLAGELVIYDWIDVASHEVFTQFTAEYGVEIRYAGYESPEDAVADLRAGQVYDLVVLENQYIPELVAAGLLAELNKTHIPNFKYVPASFRDLVYDPGNRYTIPYTWGTTGLLVRTDLAAAPVTRWADMWDARYAGKVVNWKSGQRYVLGTALVALGYSVNSENPVELAAALNYLRALEPNAIWLVEEPSISPQLLSGEGILGLGWSYDYWEAIEQDENIAYVLPDEGTLLWGDTWIIPANSPNKYTAELFLNFVLRPDIAAQIVAADYFAIANDGVNEFLDPELLSDDIIYPSNADLANAQFIMPLSAAGTRLWDETWNRFVMGQ